MVIFLQRLVPHYRYELFNSLNELFPVKVICSPGQKKGAASGIKVISTSGFINQSLSLQYSRNPYRIVQPFLLLSLIKLRPKIIITEATPYFPNNFIAFLYAKLFSVNFIWWEPGRTTIKKGLRKIIEFFVKMMIENANGYLCYSTSAKNYLINTYKIDKNNIVVAQNSFKNTVVINQDEEKRIINDHQLANYKHIFGYVGAIERRKRLEALFKLAETQKDCYFFIIGDGEDLNHYKKINSELALSNTAFIGKKNIDESNNYIRLWDAMLLPEQGGLAINHALSNGTPVICGANDGTEHDLIKNGFNGFILGANFQADILNIVKNFNQHNFNRVKIMEYYNSNHTFEQMVEKISNLIKNIGNDKS